MEAVRESAEYHFLTTLEKIKKAPRGWMALHFSLSRLLDHKKLVAIPQEIEGKLSKVRIKSEAFMDELLRLAPENAKSVAYLFTDNDVVYLAHVETEEQRKALHSLYQAMAKTLRTDFSTVTNLATDFYSYQRLADQKFLSCKRFEAYYAMTDKHKVESIQVRRKRRDEPRVLIVEDDRFTASYTANILSKDYDVTVCRNGEDAIAAYIDQAPDIVFLDIHLPGLSGHDTLQAMRATDPAAFIVVVSVDTMKDNIVAAALGGAQNFLKKPFSKERLLHIVRSSPHVRGISLH
jgi:CheY-like chemotaxis protein